MHEAAERSRFYLFMISSGTTSPTDCPGAVEWAKSSRPVASGPNHLRSKRGISRWSRFPCTSTATFSSPASLCAHHAGEPVSFGQHRVWSTLGRRHRRGPFWPQSIRYSLHRQHSVRWQMADLGASRSHRGRRDGEVSNTCVAVARDHLVEIGSTASPIAFPHGGFYPSGATRRSARQQRRCPPSPFFSGRLPPLCVPRAKFPA